MSLIFFYFKKIFIKYCLKHKVAWCYILEIFFLNKTVTTKQHNLKFGDKAEINKKAFLSLIPSPNHRSNLLPEWDFGYADALNHGQFFQHWLAIFLDNGKRGSLKNWLPASLLFIPMPFSLWFSAPPIKRWRLFHLCTANLVLSSFTWLHFADVVLFINWRQEPPHAKRLRLA